MRDKKEILNESLKRKGRKNTFTIEELYPNSHHLLGKKVKTKKDIASIMFDEKNFKNNLERTYLKKLENINITKLSYDNDNKSKSNYNIEKVYPKLPELTKFETSDDESEKLQTAVSDAYRQYCWSILKDKTSKKVKEIIESNPLIFKRWIDDSKKRYSIENGLNQIKMFEDAENNVTQFIREQEAY